MGDALKSTPLGTWHEAHGARMVPFAGFSMPVQYATGIQEEVRLVRNECGLFDISHMGRLVVRGAARVEACDHVLSQNVGRIPEGAIRYALVCTPEGTVVDDVLVYRGRDAINVVINAGGREADEAWFREHAARFDISIENVSDAQAMLALQGPRSADLLQPLTDVALGALKYYRFTEGGLRGPKGAVPAMISRTGYTGEDGFELFFPVAHARPIWEALVAAGASPIGLGARDICRTEAGMPLYGHEMNLEISPLEAGLDFGIDLEKPFVGRDALVRQKRAGVARRLVGLRVEGKRVPREQCPLVLGDRPVGFVTSGTYSPTLDRPIAMALVESALAREGEEFEADLRGKRVPVRVDGLPFYSRKRAKKSPGGQ